MSTHDTIPDLSLVVLIGASGSGKSTFARRHFLPTEMISSDACRGLVSRRRERPGRHERRLRGAALHRRQAPGRRPADRGRRHQRAAGGAPAAGGAGPRSTTACRWPSSSTCPSGVCQERNRGPAGPRLRPARGPPADRASCAARCAGCEREGFRHVFILRSPEEVDGGDVERQPLWNNRKDEHGPFDIIGDVHGCSDELEELLARSATRRRARQSLGGTRRSTRIPRGARRSSSATWWTAARASWTRCAWCMAMVDAGTRPLRAGQPRHEADARAARAGRAGHARAGDQPGRARGAARRCACRRAPRYRRLPRLRWSATTCSTTASWWWPTPG